MQPLTLFETVVKVRGLEFLLEGPLAIPVAERPRGPPPVEYFQEPGDDFDADFYYDCSDSEHGVDPDRDVPIEQILAENDEWLKGVLTLCAEVLGFFYGMYMLGYTGTYVYEVVGVRCDLIKEKE